MSEDMKCIHYWTVTSECPKCLRAEVDRLTDELDATRAEMERLRAEHRAEIERLRADIERIEDEAWHDGAKHGTSH